MSLPALKVLAFLLALAVAAVATPALAQEQPVVDEGALHAQQGAYMPVLLDLRPLDAGDRWQVKIRSGDLQTSHDECHGPDMAVWYTVPDVEYEALGYHEAFTHELFASSDCLVGRYVFVLYWMVPTGINSFQIHSTESHVWEIHPKVLPALSADATVDDDDVEEGTAVNLSASFDAVAVLYATFSTSLDSLWEVDRNTPGDTTHVGRLPDNLDSPAAMTSHNGELLIVDSVGDDLWLGNRTTPSSSAEIGQFPSGLTSPNAMTSHNGELLIADNGGDELWLGNRTTPSSSAEIGQFPSGLTSPFGMTSHNGELLIADGSARKLWLVNRTTPSSSAEIGQFPSGLATARGMTSHNGELLIADNGGDELWLGNRTTPSSSMLIGSFPSSLTLVDALASFIPSATYSWSSNSGGVFGNASAASTTWQLDDVSSDTVATLTVTITAGTETASANVVVTVRNANEPPGVPENLSLSSSAADSITATWQPPSSGGDVDTYRLRYGRTAEPNRLVITGITTTIRTVTGLDPDTRYDFEVRARNSEGNSPWSSPPEVGTTLSNPPGIPRNLNLVPESSTAIFAEWDAPLLGGTVGTYEVRYGVASESDRQDVTNIADRFVEVSGLAPATEYAFMVRARNGGGVSTFTTERTVATLAAPLESGIPTADVTEFTNRGGRMLTTGVAGWVLLSVVSAMALGWAFKNSAPLPAAAVGLILPLAAGMWVSDDTAALFALGAIMAVEVGAIGMVAIAVRR